MTKYSIHLRKKLGAMADDLNDPTDLQLHVQGTFDRVSIVGKSWNFQTKLARH